MKRVTNALGRLLGLAPDPSMLAALVLLPERLGGLS
jgi:hypothetical protein